MQVHGPIVDAAVVRRVWSAAEIPGASRPLPAGEQAELDALGYAGARLREWTLGRAAMRSALSQSPACLASPACLSSDPEITTGSTGAPQVKGAGDVAVSLSHDGGFFSVIAGRGQGIRVATDLCSLARAPRLPRVLARVAGHVPACPQQQATHWAAIECALKLRGIGVLELLRTPVLVTREAGRAVVTGLGAPALVTVSSCDAYALAFAAEGPCLGATVQ